MNGKIEKKRLVIAWDRCFFAALNTTYSIIETKCLRLSFNGFGVM